jgi:16S rRNA (guanine1516-N2)-methyltransferase
VGLPYAQATRVDFSDPALLYRLRTSGKRQGLGKAVGLDKTKGPVRVLDATAGLGRDALVLAHLGCEVELLERSPWVHALLDDGFRRARNAKEDSVRNAVSRMRLVHGDARERLRALAGSTAAPDVIYLDPMFPPRRKSAAVKKHIGLLQGVLGFDDDIAELLTLALAAARRRVVVKRPPDRAEIAGPLPSFTLSGKAAHFSVYVNSSFSSTR